MDAFYIYSLAFVSNIPNVKRVYNYFQAVFRQFLSDYKTCLVNFSLNIRPLYF